MKPDSPLLLVGRVHLNYRPLLLINLVLVLAAITVKWLLGSVPRIAARKARLFSITTEVTDCSSQWWAIQSPHLLQQLALISFWVPVPGFQET